MASELPSQLHEWGHCSITSWGKARRDLLTETVAAWKSANRLNTLPLSVVDGGQRLYARQFVGVVEVDGASIEIYPKLDAALLDDGSELTPQNTQTVMRNLLWMLEVSERRDIAEVDTAALEEVPDNFFDLFAYLLARRLLPELQNGVPRTYRRFEDDLRAVRGRIDISRQVSHNWDRRDRIACVWDEFTPDIPLNRLLKCACRMLQPRVRHVATGGLLTNCVELLDEVSDVAMEVALFEGQDLRWDRGTERFRLTFDLARRLLEGTSHALGTGSADTFVFLLNMNEVFENFAQAVLETQLGVSITPQKLVGTLFDLKVGGIQQKADYYWELNRQLCIGDAKYKHLTIGRQDSLRFSEIAVDEDIETQPLATAGRLLSTDDVRQLTVYAQLANLGTPTHSPAELLLLYPFVGDGRFEYDCAPAWNGSHFWLVPIRLNTTQSISAALPFGFTSDLQNQTNRRSVGPDQKSAIVNRQSIP